MILCTYALVGVRVYASSFSSETTSTASVHFQDGEGWSVTKGFDANGIAWRTFKNGLMTDGWGVLNIETSSKFPDEKQAYAAGLVEGI